MRRLEVYPPPNWTQIIILWNDILEGPKYPIKKILDWIETAEGDEYTLTGFNTTEGFSFKFKNSSDATYFKLKWL